MSDWPRATFLDEDGSEYYWNFWVDKDKNKFIGETEGMNRAQRELHYKMYFEQIA
jgi:hypothetical protein|tara:strand:- start:3356 stop:3520 length:165 start_codon:yes stop_codon:yes gene_type:complete